MLESRRDAVIGVGSAVIAIGFWGLVIDLALKYSFYQQSLVIETDNTLWFFCLVFFLGLLVVGLAAASPSEPAPTPATGAGP